MSYLEVAELYRHGASFRCLRHVHSATDGEEEHGEPDDEKQDEEKQTTETILDDW